MRHLISVIRQAGRAALLAAALGSGQTAFAQNVFSPAATVNEAIITEYEVAQRQRFLTLLNAPGAAREPVLEELIKEALRNQAVADAGFELTEEELVAGIEEFAARVDLGGEEFIAVLEENGVAEETLRSFVSSGIGWREYVRARFGGRAQVTEDEIDQALGTGASGGSVRLLLSEIVIPTQPQTRAQVEELAQQISAAETTAEFETFAREFSAAPSRENNGRLPWRGLSEIPASLRPILLGLAPGEISVPIPLPNAVAVFQLRDIEEVAGSGESYAAIDYAAYFIPGGRTEATLATAKALQGRVDICDDLYGEAFGQPPEVLQRETLPPSDIPADFARELSKLDPGEVSTALTTADGQALIFLMLCGRTAAINEEVDRAQAANALRQNRLNGFASSFEAQLRADARIEIK